MASRKKAYVLLRGKLSGKLIFGSRLWYEANKPSASKLWKLVAQHDDESVLRTMADIGQEKEPSMLEHADKW